MYKIILYFLLVRFVLFFISMMIILFFFFVLILLIYFVVCWNELIFGMGGWIERLVLL